MEAQKKIEQLLKGESTSRISSYILIGDICSGKTEYLKTLEGITYYDFEESAEYFFKNAIMTPQSFDLGKFFKEIKKITVNSGKLTVVDNLEIIANILYNKNLDKSGVKKFFSDSVNQVFKENVIFVFSEVNEIRIGKCIAETNFPEKNIIKWGI
ncbi:MAG: hypothetical protein KA384_05055 [Leptotrichiaceae bacterium]|nr:hypothetical protein [Leptotrichiaceae bacterium]